MIAIRSLIEVTLLDNIREEAIASTLKEEGGYGNDPDDAGGETNFGISKRSHPDIDIRALTEERARQIYIKEYWDVIEGDALPRSWALALMDAAVRMGPFRAVCLMQGTLKVEVDGKVGPVTVTAAWNNLAWSTIDSFLAGCMAFYVRTTNQKYHTGQLLRTLRLRDLLPYK